MPQPIEHDYEASCWLRKLQEVVWMWLSRWIIWCLSSIWSWIRMLLS